MSTKGGGGQKSESKQALLNLIFGPKSKVSARKNRPILTRNKNDGYFGTARLCNFQKWSIFAVLNVIIIHIKKYQWNPQTLPPIRLGPH